LECWGKTGPTTCGYSQAKKKGKEVEECNNTLQSICAKDLLAPVDI
jgi:hypothetical protein